MYHPSSSVFVTNKTPSGTEKHHESTEPESSKMAKMFSFLLSSSSEWLAQHSVNFPQWFTHETAPFCTEQCTTPLFLHNIEVLQSAHSHSLNNYGFHFGVPFPSLMQCMRTSGSPSNNLRLITQDR